MTISASQVKELREKTGIGMMECKKALVENSGNMEKAIIWLRERGMARAEKKSGRTAADGTVVFALSSDKKQAAILELNCETDFSAKNVDFQAFAQKMVDHCLATQSTDLEAFKATKIDGESVAEGLAALITKVGENMALRRIRYFNASNGFIAGYSHMGGRIGTLVVFEGAISEKAAELGNDVAMHIAASAPRFLTRDQVSPEELAQEKDLASKKLEQQGKTGDILEKILVGQMNKFFSETCLVDQPFVKEPKLNVEKYIQQSGTKLRIADFARFQLGEGIEVQKTNFSDEVAAALKN
jgi:elongation factor Ts